VSSSGVVIPRFAKRGITSHRVSFVRLSPEFADGVVILLQQLPIPLHVLLAGVGVHFLAAHLLQVAPGFAEHIGERALLGLALLGARPPGAALLAALLVLAELLRAVLAAVFPLPLAFPLALFLALAALAAVLALALLLALAAALGLRLAGFAALAAF